MLDTSKTYLVLNYCTSQIAVSTRHDSIMIGSGSDENPSTYPFTLDEIRYINNSSKVFKIGLLFFEPEYADEIYQDLRIHNYADILTHCEIEEMLENPTDAKLRRLIGIEDPMYFERIYGVFVGMKNAGFRISSNVDEVLSVRYREFQQRKRTTGIVIESVAQKPVQNDTESAEIAKLKKQVEELMERMCSDNKPTSVSYDSKDPESPKTAQNEDRKLKQPRKTASQKI